MIICLEIKQIYLMSVSKSEYVFTLNDLRIIKSFVLKYYLTEKVLISNISKLFTLSNENEEN